MAVCAVTRHAMRRVRERVGLPKKAVRRAAARAMSEGMSRENTGGSLRRYLDRLYQRRDEGGANNIMLYGTYIYLFDDDTLVTVFLVPMGLQKQAIRQQRRRKGAQSDGMQS